MRAAQVAALTIAAAAAFPAAADIVLRPPVDCALGQTCFIQQYVDHDRTGRSSDFRCGGLANNGHTGTDFRVPTLRDVARGVNVVASAPGRVRGVRDGMEDRLFRQSDSSEVHGRDCGNGVVIDHADGWSTQYCHLKRGSVRVRSGAQVAAGTVLGQIGSSGRSSFPHVHLTVRKDGDVVDPFDPDGQITCGAPSTDTLWNSDITYQSGAIMDVGFADAVPDYGAVRAGTATQDSLPRTAPAIVVFGFAFGGQAGDLMRLTIDGPAGTVIDEVVTLDKTQPQLFRAVGKRLTTDAWPAGTYRGTVSMQRNGKVISTRRGDVIVR